MTTVPQNFDGRGNLEAWTSSLDHFFKGVTHSEEAKAMLAKPFMSSDVRACINSLSAHLEAISEKEWVWTWPRLKVALQTMSMQIAYYRAEADRIRTAKIMKGVAIIGTGLLVSVAAPFAVLGVLGAVGFGAGGVAAGSAAAGIQASIGAVQAGSAFAFCQSAAAGGAALMTVVEASTLTAAAFSVGGTVANAAAWRRINEGMPSYSWEDGDEFRPSPHLIAALLGLE